jgi:VanZ family protein
MLSLRYARRWRTAGIVLLLLVLAATLMPVVWLWSDRRQVIAWFFEFDKWLHGITFVFLAIWFSGQYPPRSYWRIGIGLIFFGLLIEASQRMVTYRSAELFDIVADAAGIAVGLVIAVAGAGGWSLRIEDWYARRKAGPDLE